MKKALLSILFLYFLSCQEEGVLTQNQNTETINPESMLWYYGSFVPTSGIMVSGEAKIYFENNQFKVQLENFSISDGPDLKVYLSKSAAPTQFVNLGNLTQQTVYTIPAGIQVSAYSHVLIHCQQYNHLFAIAELQQN
ncbi:DM13 domain-containing protein [Flavobacterium sedimenticola]|uniref:DM13 domain-containing protein n=1 Tax=Flavobacterium sedimenticola TaxID=3043286 RepID=A0ABT6XSD9_9FLAO|nr:DM13 domain-containing protein [Flavobacterium sedimenticola]MDI9258008.1 DM13 domain-containing protein [Flavobacterium sedimenticola]